MFVFRKIFFIELFYNRLHFFRDRTPISSHKNHIERSGIKPRARAQNKNQKYKNVIVSFHKILIISYGDVTLVDFGEPAPGAENRDPRK